MNTHFLHTRALQISMTALLFWSTFAVNANAQQPKQVQPVHRSDVLVVMKEGYTPTAQLQSSAGATAARQVRTQALAERIADRQVAGQLRRTYAMSGKRGVSAEQLIARLEQDPRVERVEPNVVYQIQSTPNDRFFDYLWGLHNTLDSQIYDIATGTLVSGTTDADIDAPEAWNTSTGNGVVVAVLDDGVDITQTDIDDNLWVNPGEIDGNGIDDDNNGYVDDVNGWDFLYDVADPSPLLNELHGTHVAGTIAAEANNSTDIAGVAPNAQIMALRVCNTTGCDSAAIIEAINFMMVHDVQISNHSYSGNTYNSILESAFAALQEETDHVAVVAAGNETTNNDTTPSYPANFAVENLISVGASDHNDQLASFSNFGETVDLTAPGTGIFSLVPYPAIYGMSVQPLDGTSMAAPHVTGVAALVAAHRSNASGTEIRDAILDSVDQKTALHGKVATGGRLNANGALNVPFAQIAASTTQVEEGNSVAFSSNGSRDPQRDTLRYAWNFGDGSSVASAANPTHTFTQPGTYTVSLTVNDGTLSATEELQIVVTEAPVFKAAATASISGVKWKKKKLKWSGPSDARYVIKMKRVKKSGKAKVLKKWKTRQRFLKKKAIKKYFKKRPKKRQKLKRVRVTVTAIVEGDDGVTKARKTKKLPKGLRKSIRNME